jgi:hypothetical protein
MTMEAKKEAIKTKNACFKCLKKGHLVKVCRERTVCTQCNGSHYQVMCPNDVRAVGGTAKSGVSTTNKDEKHRQRCNFSSKQLKPTFTWTDSTVLHVRVLHVLHVDSTCSSSRKQWNMQRSKAIVRRWEPAELCKDCCG